MIRTTKSGMGSPRREQMKMKRFEVLPWADDAIGQGFELYWRGQYIGTSGKISILRYWARKCWQQLDD